MSRAFARRGILGDKHRPRGPEAAAASASLPLSDGASHLSQDVVGVATAPQGPAEKRRMPEATVRADVTENPKDKEQTTDEMNVDSPTETTSSVRGVRRKLSETGWSELLDRHSEQEAAAHAFPELRLVLPQLYQVLSMGTSVSPAAINSWASDFNVPAASISKWVSWRTNLDSSSPPKRRRVSPPSSLETAETFSAVDVSPSSRPATATSLQDHANPSVRASEHPRTIAESVVQARPHAFQGTGARSGVAPSRRESLVSPTTSVTSGAALFPTPESSPGTTHTRPVHRGPQGEHERRRSNATSSYPPGPLSAQEGARPPVPHHVTAQPSQQPETPYHSSNRNVSALSGQAAYNPNGQSGAHQHFSPSQAIPAQQAQGLPAVVGSGSTLQSLSNVARQQPPGPPAANVHQQFQPVQQAPVRGTVQLAAPPRGYLPQQNFDDSWARNQQALARTVQGWQQPEAQPARQAVSTSLPHPFRDFVPAPAQPPPPAPTDQVYPPQSQNFVPPYTQEQLAAFYAPTVQSGAQTRVAPRITVPTQPRGTQAQAPVYQPSQQIAQSQVIQGPPPNAIAFQGQPVAHRHQLHPQQQVPQQQYFAQQPSAFNGQSANGQSAHGHGPSPQLNQQLSYQQQQQILQQRQSVPYPPPAPGPSGYASQQTRPSAGQGGAHAEQHRAAAPQQQQYATQERRFEGVTHVHQNGQYGPRPPSQPFQGQGQVAHAQGGRPPSAPRPAESSYYASNGILQAVQRLPVSQELVQPFQGQVAYANGTQQAGRPPSAPRPAEPSHYAQNATPQAVQRLPVSQELVQPYQGQVAHANAMQQAGRPPSAPRPAESSYYASNGMQQAARRPPGPQEAPQPFQQPVAHANAMQQAGRPPSAPRPAEPSYYAPNGIQQAVQRPPGPQQAAQPFQGQVARAHGGPPSAPRPAEPSYYAPNGMLQAAPRPSVSQEAAQPFQGPVAHMLASAPQPYAHQAPRPTQASRQPPQHAGYALAPQQQQAPPAQRRESQSAQDMLPVMRFAGPALAEQQRLASQAIQPVAASRTQAVVHEQAIAQHPVARSQQVAQPQPVPSQALVPVAGNAGPNPETIAPPHVCWDTHPPAQFCTLLRALNDEQYARLPPAEQEKYLRWMIKCCAWHQDEYTMRGDQARAQGALSIKKRELSRLLAFAQARRPALATQQPEAERVSTPNEGHQAGQLVLAGATQPPPPSPAPRFEELPSPPQTAGSQLPAEDSAVSAPAPALSDTERTLFPFFDACAAGPLDASTPVPFIDELDKMSDVAAAKWLEPYYASWAAQRHLDPERRGKIQENMTRVLEMSGAMRQFARVRITFRPAAATIVEATLDPAQAAAAGPSTSHVPSQSSPSSAVGDPGPSAQSALPMDEQEEEIRILDEAPTPRGMVTPDPTPEPHHRQDFAPTASSSKSVGTSPPKSKFVLDLFKEIEDLGRPRAAASTSQLSQGQTGWGIDGTREALNRLLKP